MYINQNQQTRNQNQQTRRDSSQTQPLLGEEDVMPGSIREEYIAKNPRSAELYPKFRDVFPSGGAGHDGYVAEPFPIAIARGQGPRKWDVDGNEYVDYGLGSASLLLGHSHPCRCRGAPTRAAQRVALRRSR